MHSQTTGILKLRRATDKRRILLAYCVAGLLMSFAQVAMSAEVCVDNYADAEKSSSKLIRDAVPLIRGQSMTNKSDGTHLKFSPADRIYVKLYSSKGFMDNKPDFQEGVITVCDKNGELSLKSVLSPGAETFAFEGNCFKLTGVLARAGGDKTHFCPGRMPARVQGIFDRESDNASYASQPRQNSSEGSVRQ